MNGGPIIAGIAFGLLASPPPAFAGGYVYCRPDYCWSQPYAYSPPVYRPPICYSTPQGLRPSAVRYLAWRVSPLWTWKRLGSTPSRMESVRSLTSP
jgi:hypothetical protein